MLQKENLGEKELKALEEQTKNVQSLGLLWSNEINAEDIGKATHDVDIKKCDEAQQLVSNLIREKELTLEDK